MTSLKDIVPAANIVYLSVLVLSWMSFVIAILCIGVSFIHSQKAYELQLRLAEEYCVDGKEDALKKENSFRTTTDRLNNASIVAFVGALLLTIGFVVGNLSRLQVAERRRMPKTPASPLEEKGVSAAKVPKAPQPPSRENPEKDAGKK